MLGLPSLFLSNQIGAQPFECITPGTKLCYEIHNKKRKVTDCQQTVVLGIEKRDSWISQLAVYFDKEWNPKTDKNGIAIEPDSTEAIWGKKWIIGKKGRLMDYMELVKIEWPHKGTSVSER